MRSTLWLLLACPLMSCSGGKNTLPRKIVEITGDDETKFNIASFEAKAVQQVTVSLKNIGELPKEAMSRRRHQLLRVRKSIH